VVTLDRIFCADAGE
jgi:hypothetical protein